MLWLIAAEDGFTPLHVAASMDRLEIVEALIEAGADVNKTTEDGFTPLHVAASMGHLGIVKDLIGKKGINVDQQLTENQATALHIAAEKGHVEIVQDLIKAEADVDKVTRYGGTALMIATEKNHEAIVNTLRNTPSKTVFLSFAERLLKCLKCNRKS